jgi:hypothetical protein
MICELKVSINVTLYSLAGVVLGAGYNLSFAGVTQSDD